MMKKLLVLSLQSENGTVAFVKNDFAWSGCRLIDEEIDESYHFEDVCDLVTENEADACLILAGEGCCLFAARFALSLSALLRDEADVLVLSQELLPGKQYQVENAHFFALAHREELDRYLAGEEFQPYDVKLSELPYDHSERYALAMRNGIIVSLTGLYPNGTSGSGKHITMKNAAEFLRSVGALKPAFNSAVIFEDEPFDRALHEKLLRVPGFTCHFHYSCGDGNFTFDHSGLCSRLERVGLAEYLARPDTDADPMRSYIADIRSKEDFSALRELLSDFFGKGTIRKHNFWLTNECMFTGVCMLYKLPRYKVSDRELYPCGGSLDLGSLDTPPLKRMAQLNAARDRLGYDCVVMDAAFREEYQRLLADYPNVSEFFSQKNLYHSLKLSSKLFRSPNAIRVSNSGFSSVYQGEARNTDGEGLPGLGLYRIGDRFYVVDLKKMTIITVDPKIALILEGMMKKAAQTEIELAFRTVCHVDPDTAAALYEKGYAMIRKGGLI